MVSPLFASMPLKHERATAFDGCKRTGPRAPSAHQRGPAWPAERLISKTEPRYADFCLDQQRKVPYRAPGCLCIVGIRLRIDPSVIKARGGRLASNNVMVGQILFFT